MGIVSAITDVFSEVMEWIVSAFDTVSAVFWNSTEGSLTLLGVLAICGLSFSVAFLLIGIIQRFIKFGA